MFLSHSLLWLLWDGKLESFDVLMFVCLFPVVVVLLFFSAWVVGFFFIILWFLIFPWCIMCFWYSCTRHLCAFPHQFHLKEGVPLSYLCCNVWAGKTWNCCCLCILKLSDRYIRCTGNQIFKLTLMLRN